MHNLTLRTRLTLLVVAGVLPLILYMLGTTYLGFREDRDRVGRQALDLARSLARAVEAEVQTRIAILEVLALSPALQTGEMGSFRAQADAVLAHQMPGASILLLGEDGRQAMNTALAPGAPLPVLRPSADRRRVFASRSPAVSDLYDCEVAGRPVVAIQVPVRDPDGGTRRTLALNPTVDTFAAVIRRQKPQADWVVTLLDGAGVPIARVPEGDALVGTQIPAELLARRAREPSGMLDLVSPEGERMVAAYTRLAGSEWTIAVGSPLARLTGPAWRHALISCAVGLALLGLGLLLARRIAGGIIGPISGLRLLAARAEDGAAPPPVTGLHEVDEVAQALLDEGRRRRAAMASLLDSDRRLRLVVAELNHRAKNALATVQALAMQTARGEADPVRFSAAFGARLRTLARAHDLLTAFAWEAAALDAVVRAGLAPWLGAGDTRIRLGWDAAVATAVSPGQAQALVLALHELATNAVRHGALSTPAGRVLVTCRPLEDGAGVLLDWRESDGPAVAGPPARLGFGLRLLERALAHDLGTGSRVTLEFPPSGMHATIRIATVAAATQVPACAA